MTRIVNVVFTQGYNEIPKDCEYRSYSYRIDDDDDDLEVGDMCTVLTEKTHADGITRKRLNIVYVIGVLPASEEQVRGLKFIHQVIKGFNQ